MKQCGEEITVATTEVFEHFWTKVKVTNAPSLVTGKGKDVILRLVRSIFCRRPTSFWFVKTGEQKWRWSAARNDETNTI